MAEERSTTTEGGAPKRSGSGNLLLILAIACLCAFLLMSLNRKPAQTNEPEPQAAGSEEVSITPTQTAAPVFEESGVSMQAERGKDTLEIERTAPSGKAPDNLEQDSWTILVYLCGSDLESKAAAATQDLNEMIQGKTGGKVRFVVETGGAKTWRNRVVASNKLGRYVVSNGDIKDGGAVSAASMGEPKTLAEFINWGVTNYPAEHMGLVLWDHGGGSITGVCFDEVRNRDSLLLRELDAALAASSKTMWDKFDFIGFDACLMATLETANVVASYADYMVASQESEPSGGWEYSAIGNYLASNPDADGNELGKTICKTYLDSLKANTKGFSTLSVVDLSKIDQLIQDYHRFSQEMYESGNDQAVLAQMTRAIHQVDNYGCNNRREGYTNMVDLGGIVDACAQLTPSATAVKQSLHDAVTYQIRGTYHADACGLSTYYPLAITNAQELKIFQTVAVNPSYLSYVDRLAHGATYNGGSQYQQYNDDSFWQGNFWNWLLGNSGEQQQQAQEAQDHWDYVDDHTETSTQITFASEPQVDDEGTFWFQFDKNGINNAAVVSGMVYERDKTKGNYIVLGETYDVYGDWETGEFADGFDGRWLSLPDGQNLNLCVEGLSKDHIVYTSPILLNGEECYLRLYQNIEDGKVVVEGVWSAVDASGAVDRGMTPLEKGDEITPLYRAISSNDGTDSSDYEGDAYKLDSDELSVDYRTLGEGEYLYSFFIQDVYGDTFYTAAAQFDVDGSGTVYFG